MGALEKPLTTSMRQTVIPDVLSIYMGTKSALIATKINFFILYFDDQNINRPKMASEFNK